MRRHAVLAGTLLVTLVTLVSAGCAESTKAPDPPTEFEKAVVDFERVAVRRGVVLADVTRPTPPVGYDAVDVDVAVRDAIQILDRSVDPTLSSLAPNAAVSQVLAKQYDETRNGMIKAGQRQVGTGWQWLLASRFPAKARPRSWTIEARAWATPDADPQVRRRDRWLAVTVRAHFLHRLRTGVGDRLVVTKRVITLTIDPENDLDSRPGFGVTAAVYGDDFCTRATSATMRPTDETTVLARSADALEASLRDTDPPRYDADTGYQRRARACSG